MDQARADPHVVQQLMFNRLLSYVRLLTVEGVTIAGFDAETGTLVCALAGVDFVVSVSVGKADRTPG
jgi:hypothetical protein